MRNALFIGRSNKSRFNKRKHDDRIKKRNGKISLSSKEWREDAENIISLLKQLLGNTPIDIQHIGSTAIFSIRAKPIIDIAVAVHNLNDILPYIEVLKRHNIVFRGEMIAGNILFVMGSDEIRTHHIHIVKWNGAEWNNYINFRDYLNTYPEKAVLYDICKQKLAVQFPNDRKSYTAGKEEMILHLLSEAGIWRAATITS